MRTLALFAISAIYICLNNFIAWRFLRYIKPEFTALSFSIVQIIFVVCSLTTIVAFTMEEIYWGKFGTFGMYWFGFICLAFMILVVSDLLMSVLTHVVGVQLSATILYTMFIINVVSVFSLFVYGLLTAQNIVITQYKVAIDKNSTIPSLKVAMFSDLHLGYVNGAAHVEKIVERINAIEPDIILIAGDFFDGNFNSVGKPEVIRDNIQKLSSTYGNFMVLGNHDAGNSFEDMKDFLESSDIIILSEEGMIINDTIALIGIIDLSPIGNQGKVERKDFDILLPKEYNHLPIIVMDHQPTKINEYEKADLVLAGHTHRGQIFPFSVLTKFFYDLDYGYKKMMGIHK
ncbi:hypothetical protein A5886_001539 [Enterococcus sp. 8G7_MSG3316]|uniref:Calcineurin-like phosphoesterase domain-containing protein n=1 Tax=Candidatus Enterococcus testudinis TaxID=1834191 RepID=A0A242A684_9ENTE|nr:metallophosphoesterase [Enterococcus sp. 8G7_MSG3316]OTN76462.1 hypothetical protein A5886_001539 [Enterococcus sp. 8G7_MSG3316]